MCGLEILSIGHSTHSWEAFLGLLQAAEVTAIADVRSTPFSRRMPWFTEGNLKAGLKAAGIAYAPLGPELGGRPSRADLYRDGIADYEAMAREPLFEAGLDRVIKGAGSHRIAMLCSEGDPCECHRCLLVGRALKGRDVKVTHLLKTGATLSQDQVETRILAGLIGTTAEVLDRAYRLQAEKVAYRRPGAAPAPRAFARAAAPEADQPAFDLG